MGANISTDGNAIGQAVANPLNHCSASSVVKPWFTSTTAPEIIVTWMVDSKPPNSRLLYREEILTDFYLVC
jgi:hypothetical protein